MKMNFFDMTKCERMANEMLNWAFCVEPRIYLCCLSKAKRDNENINGGETRFLCLSDKTYGWLIYIFISFRQTFFCSRKNETSSPKKQDI